MRRRRNLWPSTEQPPWLKPPKCTSAPHCGRKDCRSRPRRNGGAERKPLASWREGPDTAKFSRALLLQKTKLRRRAGSQFSGLQPHKTSRGRREARPHFLPGATEHLSSAGNPVDGSQG